jgi:hypothetical protein
MTQVLKVVLELFSHFGSGNAFDRALMAGNKLNLGSFSTSFYNNLSPVFMLSRPTLIPK